MAKKKIKKPRSGKSWRDWFSWGKRKESRAAREEKREQLYRRIKIAATIIFCAMLVAAIFTGFVAIEKYTKDSYFKCPVCNNSGGFLYKEYSNDALKYKCPGCGDNLVTNQQIESHIRKYIQWGDKIKLGSLVFTNAPDWAHNEAMQRKLASSAGGGQFELKEGVAEVVGQRLAELPWLYNVRVRTTTHNVKVEAQYREPQAIIKTAKGQTCYVGLPAPGDPLCGDNPDEVNTVFVLDQVEVKKPPLIEIKGFADKLAPSAGKTWYASDVAAALKLIAALRQMDEKVSKEKPLSNEISEIDVSNFNSRQGTSAPRIVLRLRDGKTQVNWGAPMGKSASQLEASDIEKLTTLYTFYRENKNTLLNIVAFIELRYPKMGIPRPQ